MHTYLYSIRAYNFPYKVTYTRFHTVFHINLYTQRNYKIFPTIMATLRTNSITLKPTAYKNTELNLYYSCCCLYDYSYCCTYAQVDKVFVLLTPFCGRHYVLALCLINTTLHFNNANKIKGNNNNEQHTHKG